MIPMNLLHTFAVKVNSNFEALSAYLLLHSCPWLLLLAGTCCSAGEIVPINFRRSFPSCLLLFDFVCTW